MIKKFFISFLIVSCSVTLNAQHKKQSTKKHKIVFHLSTDDTLVHKSLIRQINNVLVAAPNTMLEIVCHGPGINFLVTDKTIVQEKIVQYKAKGVVFAACENTLREKNIAKEKIIPQAIFVTSALIEIVIRQEEGWSYIKSGF